MLGEGYWELASSSQGASHVLIHLILSNVLVLTSSVLAGHPYAGMSRFTVVSKSPLTGGIGETRCEGPFGSAIKGSGFDAIAIQGRAKNPTTLVVANGKAALQPASSLWGRTVNDTVDRLEGDYGCGIHTAVIGPAGEALVRFASIVTDRSYQAARMGLGAVMGSKLLKSIVICEVNHPLVADPARCSELTESYRNRMMMNPLTRWQFEPPGFSAWIHVHGTETALCTRNYRDSVFEAAGAYSPERFLDFYRHDGVCPGCPNACIKFYGTKSPLDFDERAGAIHQEITGALGSNLGIPDVQDVFKANILCNEYGLDPTSLGFTLSMAMECVEQQIVDFESQGVPLRFGAGAEVLKVIPMIAARQGIGSVLAEGTLRASRQFGHGAERYALHVKGLEMVPFEPRTQTNLALGFAVAPIGPRYDICEHDWDYDTKVGWPHTLDGSRTLGILDRIPMEYIGDDKVSNFKALNTIWSSADVLDLSIFSIAPTRVFTLDEMAQLLSAVTGWNTSSYEIMRFGERRNHLMRIYNLREGLTYLDDTLPNRFFDEPIHHGGWAGTKLDREAFHSAIQTYYIMMGWDNKGRPRREILIEQHLEPIS